MKIEYHSEFKKHYKQRIKPHPHLAQKFTQRLELFTKNPKSAELRDHKLSGKQSAFRAFSITGDYRVLYLKEGDITLFYDIGTYNQVY